MSLAVLAGVEDRIGTHHDGLTGKVEISHPDIYQLLITIVTIFTPTKTDISSVPMEVRMQIEASHMNFASEIELSIEMLSNKVIDPMKN
jgi:hypothetical protein